MFAFMQEKRLLNKEICGQICVWLISLHDPDEEFVKKALLLLKCNNIFDQMGEYQLIEKNSVL